MMVAVVAPLLDERQLSTFSMVRDYNENAYNFIMVALTPLFLP
jgi:hypothetical protein